MTDSAKRAEDAAVEGARNITALSVQHEAAKAALEQADVQLSDRISGTADEVAQQKAKLETARSQLFERQERLESWSSQAEQHLVTNDKQLAAAFDRIGQVRRPHCHCHAASARSAGHCAAHAMAPMSARICVRVRTDEAQVDEAGKELRSEVDRVSFDDKRGIKAIGARLDDLQAQLKASALKSDAAQQAPTATGLTVPTSSVLLLWRAAGDNGACCEGRGSGRCRRTRQQGTARGDGCDVGSVPCSGRRVPQTHC